MHRYDMGALQYSPISNSYMSASPGLRRPPLRRRGRRAPELSRGGGGGGAAASSGVLGALACLSSRSRAGSLPAARHSRAPCPGDLREMISMYLPAGEGGDPAAAQSRLHRPPPHYQGGRGANGTVPLTHTQGRGHPAARRPPRLTCPRSRKGRRWRRTPGAASAPRPRAPGHRLAGTVPRCRSPNSGVFLRLFVQYLSSIHGGGRASLLEGTQRPKQARGDSQLSYRTAPAFIPRPPRDGAGAGGAGSGSHLLAV